MAAVASCSSSSLCSLPTPISASHPPQPAQSMPALPAPEKPTFALARIKGDVCLVQVPPTSACAQGGMSSALMAADVHVFRHEFITLFRYSHRTTVHPADLAILEPIGEDSTLYEEDRGTVFLARDVVARMQRLTMDARRQPPPHRYTQRSRHHMSMSMPVSASRMRS
ncbi:hypothetical protein C8Q80DRAFT_1121689 [Daedaleopsis nitida]|nr:hypothetical protein C8Q80DRAFT_1121689 [Daedaleopsis nitida]